MGIPIWRCTNRRLQMPNTVVARLVNRASADYPETNHKYHEQAVTYAHKCVVDVVGHAAFNLKSVFLATTPHGQTHYWHATIEIRQADRDRLFRSRHFANGWGITRFRCLAQSRETA